MDVERASGGWVDGYQAKNSPGAAIIHRVEQKRFVSRHRATLWADADRYGNGLTLDYADVRCYTRGSTAEKTGPYEWAYRDAATGEPFDFYYPFAGLIPPPAHD